LCGDHDGSRKEPDACIRGDLDEYPLVALEVAMSESRAKAFRDANKWLEGSGGKTRLVIVVDIQESKIPERKKTTMIATWGLTDDEILQFTVTDLGRHIRDWHQRERIPLLGDFTANFYFCYYGQPQQLVWEYKFSLNEAAPQQSLMRNTCSLRAKDLLPDFEDNLDFVLPVERISAKMRRCLHVHALQRAKIQAKLKLDALQKSRDSGQLSELRD
jgi:hypothetical protein